MKISYFIVLNINTNIKVKIKKEYMENTKINEVNNYQLKITNFEGPLDLLVYLIDQNKLNISEINISEITDQYMKYIYELEKLNLEIASSFLMMASDLMYLKSKNILPSIADDDEEINEEELILRILEYKRYKSIQEELKNLYSIYSKRISKRPDKIALKNMVFDRQYELEELLEAYEFSLEKKQYLFNQLDKTVDEIASKDNYTVFSKIKEIFKKFKTRDNFVFNTMFSLKERPKNEVITAFISILELAKKNRVKLKQEVLYGDILVEKRTEEGK